MQKTLGLGQLALSAQADLNQFYVYVNGQLYLMIRSFVVLLREITPCLLHLSSKQGVTSLNIKPLLNKPWFLRVCCRSLLKTLWEKEKLLVTSNFSFSYSVLYPFGELYTISIKFETVVC